MESTAFNPDMCLELVGGTTAQYPCDHTRYGDDEIWQSLNFNSNEDSERREKRSLVQNPSYFTL